MKHVVYRLQEVLQQPTQREGVLLVGPVVAVSSQCCYKKGHEHAGQCKHMTIHCQPLLLTLTNA
jgi:hypothetical protein